MDVATLLLLNIIISVSVSLTLAITASKRYRELQIWAAGLVLHSLAYLLLSLRGHISDILSVVLANILLSATIAMLGHALYYFQQRRADRLLLWFPVLASAFVFWWFLDDMPTRLTFGGLLITLQLLTVLKLLLEKINFTPGGGQVVAIIGLLVALISMIARVLFVIVQDAPQSIFYQDSIFNLAFLGTIVSIMLFTVGFIMMVQERLHQDLLGSEAQYRGLIESAHEGIAVLNEDRCLFANQQMASLIGLQKSELIGVPFMDFVYEADRKLLGQALSDNTDNAEDTRVVDVRLALVNGKQRWFRASGMPIRWDSRPANLIFLTDIHDRKIREELAQAFAYQDALTSLPNRRLLIDQLNEEMTKSEHIGEYAALLFIDLDRFKSLNDEYGHQAGDLLLVEAARRIKAQVRKSDTVARLGGDEFVILLRGLTHSYELAKQRTDQIANKVLQTLDMPYEIAVQEVGRSKQIQYHCSGSIGVSLFKVGEIDQDEAIAQADQAMYRAKREGRGIIRYAPSPIASSSS